MDNWIKHLACVLLQVFGQKLPVKPVVNKQAVSIFETLSITQREREKREREREGRRERERNDE